jgi:RNA polymerase sigma factor for flagellar operon FliA
MRVKAEKAEDRGERDRLVMEHVALVKTLAQRLAQRLPSQVELSDLISVGVLGLIDAATRYKPGLGVPFDAFARRRIQGAMLDSLRDMDWAPRSLRRLRRDVDSAMANARRRLGREPEDLDVAEEMSMTPADYAKALDQLRERGWNVMARAVRRSRGGNCLEA